MAVSDYEVVIGLEVHVELATESKLFCSCGTKFGAEPNENVCPACAGLPGLPPVLNGRAVELGIAAGLLTNSEITPVIGFEKKNYFYPDLPTGYQITQWFAPVCRNGYVEIETSEGKREIRLKQIHIEEDAGKLVHDPVRRRSLIDLNRAGVPLIEIVSMPDFHTAEEVIAYLERLRSLLSFAGISDCRMQEGSMRCDVNISLRRHGDPKLGVRAEMKNLNSLRSISRVIAYETARHAEALDSGSGELRQETRRWDDSTGMSYGMRTKEDATDYRYFPNPELPQVEISDSWIAEIRDSLPEIASDMFRRLTAELHVSESDAQIITGSRNLAAIFNGAIANGAPADSLGAWIAVELLGRVRGEDGGSEPVIEINCAHFAKLIEMVNSGKITRAIAKRLLGDLLEQDFDPELRVENEGLAAQSDEGELLKAVIAVIEDHPDPVAQFRGGNEKVLGFLMGQVMRRTGGKADPAATNRILTEELNK